MIGLAMRTDSEILAALDATPDFDGEGIGPNGAASAKPWPYTLLRDIELNLTSTDIVRDFLPRHAMVEVHADAGGGKSAILIDMCLHIAAGREYRGRRVDMQPVLYVALEGHGGIGNRVIAAAGELDIEDVPFALVKVADNFRQPEAAQKAAALAAQLRQEHGGDCPVIVIDTYTAALGAGGSDCSPEDVTAFLYNVQQHLLGNCTVLICHHFGKDASRGSRGWTGLRAALDVECEIDRDGETRFMRITKSRDGSDSQPGFVYLFHGRQLGTNQHGEPVTAVVVEHLADEDTSKRGKRLSSKARAALECLWSCIRDPSRSFPMADEPGKRCVLMATWEAASVEPGAVSKCTREADRAKAVRAAIEELHANGESGAVIIDGARVWPRPREGDK